MVAKFKRFIFNSTVEYFLLLLVIIVLVFVFGPPIEKKLTEKSIIYDYTYPPGQNPNVD